MWRVLTAATLLVALFTLGVALTPSPAIAERAQDGIANAIDCMDVGTPIIVAAVNPGGDGATATPNDTTPGPRADALTGQLDAAVSNHFAPDFHMLSGYVYSGASTTAAATLDTTETSAGALRAGLV